MPHHNRAILKSLAEQGLDPSKPYTVDKKGRLFDGRKTKEANVKKQPESKAKSLPVEQTKVAEEAATNKEETLKTPVVTEAPKVSKGFEVPSSAKKVSSVPAEQEKVLEEDKQKKKSKK